MHRLPGWLRRAYDRPFVGVGVRSAALLLTFVVIEWWVLGVARLTVDAYGSGSIAVEVLRRLAIPSDGLGAGYLARLVIALLLVALLVRRRATFTSAWSALDQGAVLRLVVGVPALILAWAYSTYPINFVFDQAHLLDRVGLAGLALLTLWRPLFALPTALATVAIAGQFFVPLGGYSVAEQFMLVRILLLFSAWAVVRSFWREVRAADLLFVVFTLVAAGYVAGGLSKFRLGWFGLGRIPLLLPDAFNLGWLRVLGEDGVGVLTRRLLHLDGAMVAWTFVVECLALFALVRRRVLLFFLGAWIAFHLGVVSMSGIFFWKWIAVEATLFVLLWTRSRDEVFALFGPGRAAWSVLLVLGGTVWFHPVNLTWYSVPLSYGYRFEAEGPSGARYSFAPADMAPYDYQFALDGFGYLSPFRQLQSNWNVASSRAVAEEVSAADTPVAIEALEAEKGEVFEDPARAAAMDAFLLRFADAVQARGGDPAWRWWRAPQQVLRPSDPDAYRGQEPIERIVVTQVTALFDGERYVEFRRRVVRVVEVGSAVSVVP